MLLHALRPFLAHPLVTSLVVALPPTRVNRPPGWLSALDRRIRIVKGGSSRLDSVRAALEALAPDVQVVLVHDAARPLVTRAILDRCIQAVGPTGAAVAGWPVVDTLKAVSGSGDVTGTPDRSNLWKAQTPQAFPKEPLVAAYRRAGEAGWIETDDAAVFSRCGGTVRMVEGSAWNLKVTHPEDVPVAEVLLSLGKAAET